MPVFRAAGAVLVALSCSMLGLYKSRSVSARAKKLLLFCNGLDELFEYIEQQTLELEPAITKAFEKCDFIKKQKVKFLCIDADLNTEDKDIINNFLISLGFSAKKTECDRIKALKSVIEKRTQAAFNEKGQKCRLWQAFGVCTGLILGILLI